ncbi:MAG TPA: SDR family NAD(P)-dependent oxidoreductase, partial [Terriglobales bacterium]|nr:SDR family NAD(P)-dependent oxidoreductase [Terriglobales bacterium]
MTAIPGSTVLLTGASYGLGQMLARELAGRGASLALVARSREPLEKLAVALRSSGGRVVSIPADLADPAAPEHVFAQAVAALGH